MEIAYRILDYPLEKFKLLKAEIEGFTESLDALEVLLRRKRPI